MGTVYRKELVEGVTVPAIIHNSSYFYVNMAVYEDGRVSCWHLSDLEQFKADLRKGWVLPCVPAGKRLSVHGLGDFPVLDARWKYDEKGFYSHVKDTVRMLNPEMENIYHTTEREMEKWKKARVCWSGSPTPCKLKKGFGYKLLDGSSSNIFYRRGGRLYLTQILAFEDKTLQIDVEKDNSFQLEEINEMFEKGVFCTSPEEEEWVIIEGLGEVLLREESRSYRLPEQEKRKEVAEMVHRAAKEPDAHDRCIEAHYQYLIDPNDWTREALRKAYEAVPEHERMYLGDMDTKDSDFRRILESPQRKREV